MPLNASAAVPVCLDEIYRREPASQSVLVADGYGIDIRVHRGQLTVSDGIGDTRRHRTVSRARRTVRRLVILGDTGSVTLDAVRWCADLGITVVQVDRAGRPLLVASPPGQDDARIRRAQALAPTSPVGVAVVQHLLIAKLGGHEANLRHLGQDVAAGRLADLASTVGGRDIDGCRDLEAQAANLYFGAWAGTVTIRWANRDQHLVPDRWHTFGTRTTPLQGGKTPRNAADPINALANYGYALAEVECRSACVVLGLDPGLGISHRDTRNRDSFALDLLEAIRPDVERSILDLLAIRYFRRGDFRETRDGRCQLLAPLTHDLANLMPNWARTLAPHAEHVARLLADAADGKVQVRTPLTQANYRKAQNAVRVQRRKHRGDAPVRPAGSCRDCGVPLTDPKRVLCGACWPVHRRKLAADRAAAGQGRRAQLAATGSDPTQTPEAKAARTAGRAARADAERTWVESHPTVVPDWKYYENVIRPALEGVPLSVIREATRLSVAGCSLIRSGARRPHPRHLEALASVATAPRNGLPS